MFHVLFPSIIMSIHVNPKNGLLCHWNTRDDPSRQKMRYKGRRVELSPKEMTPQVYKQELSQRRDTKWW